MYCTRAIITCGIFFTPFLETISLFSKNSVLMFGQYSRGVCNQEQVMMARVQYTRRLCDSNKQQPFEPTYSLVIVTESYFLYLLFFSRGCWSQLTEFPQKKNRRHKKYDSVPTLKALHSPSRLIVEVPCGDLLLLAN